MSTGRVMWIIFCCLWAGFFFILGFATIITWLLVPFALLAILLPVGKSPRKLPPGGYHAQP
jgi:hypothetical protein